MKLTCKRPFWLLPALGHSCLYPFGLLLFFLAGCSSVDPSTRVVVYCAHDREFAEDILREFAKRSGLEVVPRYDTEANKSVGLYEDLLREARRPRCDVHWNNEILNTIRLQRQGLLEAYDSPAAAPFPASYRASDRTWTAFAARARVLLVNTKLLARDNWPASLLDLTKPQYRGQAAMAKPQFGTTATQAAALFQLWGPAKAQDFFQQLRNNGLQLVAGNKQVAVGVGTGQFALGLTDTDDAMAELDAGRPVAIIFPDRDAAADSDLGTLFIPNTVAIIKGCPNLPGARLLVDYLLSPEVEAKLAAGPSRQIPLNPQVKVDLPASLANPQTARPMPVQFDKAVDCWQAAQAFLVKEFARGE